MTPRHSLLAIGAVLVLGSAIYLVREVGRTPGDAQAARTTAPPPAHVSERQTTKTTDPPTRAVLPTTPMKPVADSGTADTPPPAMPKDDVPPPEVAQITPARTANPKLDAIMAEANRAYDHGDFDEAKQIAEKVLEKAPGNPRMLRILVSSECIAGDQAVAQKYFAQLPAGDRAQMRTRCDRYGVTLKDP